jgi:hypothetical protein
LDIADFIESSEYISDPNIAADMAVVRTICAFDTDASTTPTVEPAMLEMTPTPTP